MKLLEIKIHSHEIEMFDANPLHMTLMCEKFEKTLIEVRYSKVFEYEAKSV